MLFWFSGLFVGDMLRLKVVLTGDDFDCAVLTSTKSPAASYIYIGTLSHTFPSNMAYRYAVRPNADTITKPEVQNLPWRNCCLKWLVY